MLVLALVPALLMPPVLLLCMSVLEHVFLPPPPPGPKPQIRQARDPPSIQAPSSKRVTDNADALNAGGGRDGR